MQPLLSVISSINIIIITVALLLENHLNIDSISSHIMVKTCIVVSAVILEGNMAILQMNSSLKKWMLIGDHFGGSESPEDAIKRIVKEKTHEEIDLIDYTLRQRDDTIPLKLSINPITILIENMTYEDGKHNHIDIVFLAKLKNNSKSLISSDRDLRWFPISEMGDNDVDPKVVEVIERASSYIYDYMDNIK